jgi:hypothetical protein
MRRLGGLVLGVPALLVIAGTLSAATGRPIEWNRLPSDGLRLVEPIIAKAQISRDVSHITYPSREEVWKYLLDNPDFAADVARVLREGKYRIRRVGDHYDAEDGRGVFAVMRPLYADPGRRIFYLEGRYDTRWFPTLKGRAVLVLDTEHTQPASGVSQADVRVMGYLRIDNVLVGAFIAIARDFSERTFDAKVRKFFSHVERVSRRALEDPQGLADLLAAQPDLTRERVAEFRRILLSPRRPVRRA